MSEYNPSEAEVTKCQLVNEYSDAGVEDIARLVTGFEIIQSMEMHHYTGFLSIHDKIGVLENYPIRAEEFCLLTLNAYDLNTQITLYVRIHKVSDIQPHESNNGLTYKLHFTSAESFKANTRKITKAYEKSTSDIAKQVFHNYYGKVDLHGDELDTLYGDIMELPYTTKKHLLKDSLPLNTNIGGRNIYIQESYSQTGIVIPSYTPSKAMKFLSSVSWSAESPSCTFRFFETLENYYFVTDEFFIKRALHRRASSKKFYYGPYGSMDPNDAASTVNRIETLSIQSNGNDTGSDIFSGAYRSKVTEVDLIRRKVRDYKWNYDEDAEFIDMDGIKAWQQPPESQPHTRGFRDDTFTEENARDFIIFKDYQSAGDIRSNLRTERFIPKIIQNRVAYYHHLNNTAVSIGLKGRLDLRPGEIITVSIPSFNANSKSELNPRLSGRYMIKSIQHSMNNGTLDTSATIVKYDWSGTGLGG